MAEYVRVQKYIADCGVCSRRAAEKLMEEGKVTVDGQRVLPGAKIIPGMQEVAIGHRVIKKPVGDHLYIMLYKPRGYVTTAHDEMGRKCVTDLVRANGKRLYPVGRLDKDSEGLLLMTNDGELTNKLTHPRHHIGKTYRLIVAGQPERETLAQLAGGVVLPDGYKTAPADVVLREQKSDRAILLITIYEGRNRQIRYMCEAVGLNVLRLKRESIGKLSIGSLRSGEWRKLTPKEVEYLQQL